MADEILKRDQNFVTVLGAITDDANQEIRMVRVDPLTNRILVSATGFSSGTVTSVSVVSANGFAGSVATATTTPAITISTTVTGLLKGNGTAISAASAGTDYVAPGAVTTSGLTMTSARLLGRSTASTGAIEEITVSTGLSLSGGVLTATGGTGTVTTVSVVTANGISGSVANATTTPAITLTLGVITPTSVNGLTITANGTNTLNIAAGKTFIVSNSLTLAGTDSTVMTFPSTSATIARTDAANTFVGASTASAWVLTSPTITTKISPTTDDGAPLGDTTHNFSDLFLATGAVINYANSNVVITHTSGILTIGTGTLKIATPTNNTTSVVTVDGAQTLSSKTLSDTLILAENASIGLDPAGSADGKFTGITVTAIAGYTQAFGDLVYIDPTDSRWEATDANSAAGADGDARGILGMVVVAGTDGNACTVLLQGVIRADAKFPTFTVNNPIYVSETAGLVTQTQPSTADVVIRVVGFALTGDEMYFNPSPDYITHT